MKHTITLIAAILGACMNYVSYGQDTTSSDEAARELAQNIVKEAEKYLGAKYRSGGKGPDSFDCSGFTSFIYKKFGYNLSSSSASQINDGTAVETSGEENWKNLQLGDIVVFSGRARSKKPGHVGIYTGPGKDSSGFEFIHAARDGVRYSNVDEPYYSARFLCVRRILPDFTGTQSTSKDSLFTKDFRIIIHPNGKWEFDRADSTGKDTLSCRILLMPDGSWSMVKASSRNSSSGIHTEQKSNIGKSQSDDSSKAEYHIIKKGDTLYKIAKHNRTTFNALCKLNGIAETMTLQLGQKIRIR